MSKEIYLIASGDLRLSANQTCWPAQKEMEDSLQGVFDNLGVNVIRAHKFDEEKGHGFIDSQKMGMEVFRTIDPEQPLIGVDNGQGL